MRDFSLELTSDTQTHVLQRKVKDPSAPYRVLPARGTHSYSSTHTPEQDKASPFGYCCVNRFAYMRPNISAFGTVAHGDSERSRSPSSRECRMNKRAMAPNTSFGDE